MRRASAILARFFPELFAFTLGAAFTVDRLLGVPGPESAVLIGSLVSPALAAWTAGRPPLESGRAALARAIARSLTTLLAAATPLVAHALFVPFCDARTALVFFAFGPGIGLPIAGMIGAACRTLAKRRSVAVVLALIFTIGSIALGLAEFWSSPGVVVFGEFGGYFPGTFYDQGVTFPEAMFSFRFGSLLLAFALFVFLATADEERSRTARGVAGVALLAFLVVRSQGERLGHATSVARVDEALGAQLEGSVCMLHLPREVPVDTKRLHLEECDRTVRRIAALLGVSPVPRVDVFFYRSPQEKRALMGAGHVDLAKPWRREAHLVIDRFPHPILAHELAHVIGAELVPNVFGVPGRLFGLLPNAGLIEGFAVALAWDERMELDPHQAARALLELGMLPPVSDVTSLAFVRHPAPVAYAAAGSFMRFVMDELGADALARVYAHGSLDVLGQSPDELERRYHARLSAVELPDGAVELAATRFARPSVFHAACPHETSALRARFGGDLASGDYAAAVETADAIVAIDDGDLPTHVERVRALAFAERRDEAERAHEALAARNFPAPLVSRSLAHLGDRLWLDGDSSGARARFAGALALPQTEDAARNLEVRLYAIARGGAVEETLRALFLGDAGLPGDAVIVMHLTRALARDGEASLGAYLAARQLAARDQHRATLEQLEAVEALPTARFEREASRMRLRALFALGRHDEARALATALTNDPSAAREAVAYLERLR
jgi:tetratricopeptide (TPR) repeat protein